MFKFGFPNIWHRVQLLSLPSSLHVLPTSFHLLLFALITSAEACKLWRPSLCKFFMCLITSLPLDPSNIVNILFPDTLNIYFSLNQDTFLADSDRLTTRRHNAQRIAFQWHLYVGWYLRLGGFHGGATEHSDLVDMKRRHTQENCKPRLMFTTNVIGQMPYVDNQCN